MSRQNTVEIIVKTKDATGPGLDSVRQKYAKQGAEIEKELAKTEAIVEKASLRTGEKLGKGVVEGAKGAGTKVSENVSQELEKGSEKAGLKAGSKLKKGIVDGAKGAGTKVSEDLSGEVDKSTSSKVKLSGGKAGISWGSAFTDAAKTVFGTLVPAGAGVAAAAPLALGAGSAALGLVGGAVGGTALAGLGAGAVGLGAYLLKDNKQVEDTWSKTFKTIADDSRKAAGVLADEYVAAGKKTADIWRNDVKPSVERIFENTQPLVDKFTTGLGKAVSEFLPGVETALKNAGPAVDGFGKMLGGILKGTGDGLADLSKNSESLGTTMDLVGEGIGTSFKGALGFVGDLSKIVADNEGDIRAWGKAIGEVSSDFSLMAKNALDVLFALDGKNAKGDNLKEAIHKLVRGKDFVEPESKAVAPRLFDEAMDKQTKSADGLRAAIGFLNVQKDMGVKIDEGYIAKSSNLLAMQDDLVGSNLDLANVTGQTTDSNRSNLAAMLDLAAAGYPVRDALAGMVSGMNDAELAGLNATITTDALGRSVIEIPGYKPIVLSADAAKANPVIDGVIGRLNAVQDKYVTIRVNSVYSSTNGLGTDGKTFHDTYNKGGWVGGVGGDYDSVPSMLTPGEFVVTRKAAQQNGGLLEKINQSAGGSLQLDGMGGGSSAGGGSGGGGGGVQEVRVVFDFRGHDREFVNWMQGVIRKRGGLDQVFG